MTNKIQWIKDPVQDILSQASAPCDLKCGVNCAGVTSCSIYCSVVCSPNVVQEEKIETTSPRT